MTEGGDHRKSSGICLAVLLIGTVSVGWSAVFAAPVADHVPVYHEPGRFAGWPANHGAWSWGDEILVGFVRGDHLDRGPDRHALDPDRPRRHLLARSLDGGVTWSIEGERGSPLFPSSPLRSLEQPIDFGHPDLAFTLRGRNPARFYFSYDRGRDWAGPHALPDFGAPWISGRTDYLVRDDRSIQLFLTAGKSDGREGRTLCAGTRDGGQTWELLSWIGPEPEGFQIMTSTVDLDGGDLLTAVRRREGSHRWIETYRSRNQGKTWSSGGNVTGEIGEGNPPSLIRLRDDRLLLTYGYRAEPFGMRARLSDDEGGTWSAEIILRDDAAGWDIGYPRSVQRADGRIVTLYYYFDHETGPERYIAATIWDPDSFSTQK